MTPTSASDPETTTSTERTRPERPRIRDQIAENPLLSLFGGIIVVLLGTVLVVPNIRISDTNNRVDRLEDRMVAGFAAVDARFIELEAKFDAKFNKLEAKFDAKFNELETKFDAKFNELETKFDAKFDELETKFDELNLKLTALIAALNMTGGIEAAVSGDVAGVQAPEPLMPASDR